MAHGMASKMAYAYRLRGSGADVEEMKSTADAALVEAWQRFEKTRGAKFSSYAFVWVRGALLRRCEQGQRVRAHEGELQEVAVLSSHSPCSLVLAGQALALLSPQERDILWAHLVEEKPFHAISGTLSSSTLRRRYHRAMRRLRRLLIEG